MTPTDDAPPPAAPVPPAPALAWLTHPAFLAHMNMLQAVITRLAGSSASCKTWCSGLVTALLAFIGSTRLPQLLPLALAPIVLFAFLDTNYLSDERRFRQTFEAMARKVREGTYVDTDLFDFGPALSREARKAALREAFSSWSVLSYYGGLFLLIIALLAVWWCGGFDQLNRPSGK